ELAGSTIDAAIAHTGAAGLLQGAVTGFDGGLAGSVDLEVASPYGVDFSALRAQQGSVQVSGGEFWSRDSVVGNRLTFANPATSIVIDQNNKSLQPYDVQ